MPDVHEAPTLDVLRARRGEILSVAARRGARNVRVTAEEYDRIARSGCFVCAIVEGRPHFPSVRVVYEDEQVIAFLNQFPSQEGYTIVCPKRHVERYETDLSSDEWLYLL